MPSLSVQKSHAPRMMLAEGRWRKGEADVAAAVYAASAQIEGWAASDLRKRQSAGATGWYLYPRRATVYGLQVAVRVASPRR
jgi:hypothetical protein